MLRGDSPSRQNKQGDGRYLYRGVNADLHKSTGGRLVPKSLGQKFERRAYWGEKRYWGDRSVYGLSERNAVIMHQRDSTKYPTSGISTTPNYEHAVRYASGELPMRDASEADADGALAVRANAPKPAEGRFSGGSAYRKSFRQGATLVPRMLCLVERRSLGRLGEDPTAPFIVSRRNNQEKRPWRTQPGVEHRVEAEFLHAVLLGESILPYRVWRPFEGVVPVTSQGEVLDAEAAANRGCSGLHGWMSAAEAIWNANAQSGSMKLVDRWNYHNELGAQFPIPRLRIVYAKAGTLPAACLVRDRAIIDHMLYWASSYSNGMSRSLLK